jgi:hypothetical protein
MGAKRNYTSRRDKHFDYEDSDEDADGVSGYEKTEVITSKDT